ncbi:MAG TPA: isopeptide-forming domain-containing fimbrial protein, partial [Ilumatobacteraceae bacterium]|nr:isopeptide-forming domain-containing fimbrial protein [Ilumatobacteraceae bacterium]
MKDQDTFSARRWWRVLAAIAAIVATTATVVVVPVAPAAYAAGAATITKTLDDTQGAGYTAPDTFQAGALVRYRLRYQCSSLEEPCVTGTITDVLDPNLEYVSVIPPSSTAVTVTPSFDVATNTLTVTLGSFDDDDSGDLVVVARVKSATPGGTEIPNQASIQVPGGPVVNTEVVTIRVPPSTPNWDLAKRTSSGVTTYAAGSQVSYDVGFSALTSIGNVAVQSATLVDTYPAGAIVIDADGGVVDPVNHTITWVTGPAPVGTFPTRRVVLEFPADAFPAGSSAVNHASVSWVFADGSTGTDTAQVGVNFNTAVPSTTLTKTGPSAAVTGTSVTYNLRWRNDGNTPVVDPVITDVVPAGLTPVRLVRSDTWPAQAMHFEALVGGTWTEFASRVAADPAWVPEGSVLTLPAGTTSVRIRVEGTLPAGASISVLLAAEVTAASGATVTNCLEATAALPGGGSLTATPACQPTQIVDPYAVLHTVKSTPNYADTAATSTRPGDEFTWSLATYLDEGADISRLTVTDLLPPQLEYVSDECAILTSPNFIPYPSTLATINCSAGPTLTPTVTTAGGQQRLTWDVDLNVTPMRNAYGGTTTYTSMSAGDDGRRVLVIKFRVRVKPGTAVGSYTNEMASSSNEVPTTCSIRSAADAGDWDGDGSTTDVRCWATNTFIVDEAAVVAGEKWDDGHPGLDHVRQDTGQPSAECPDWGGYTRYPCVAQTVPSGPFSYRWRLQNIGNVELTNYVVYDVLPHVGDTGVSQLLSGEARGTDWQPNLTGPVVIESQPAGANATIEYNLSTDPCRPELNQGASDGVWQTTCDDVWLTAAAVTDWSAVRSFRVRAFQQVDGIWPGWQPLGELVLSAAMVAPANAPTSTSSPLNLSIAWNSMGTRAFRLNSSTQATLRILASEPRKVGIIIPFVENLPDLVRLGNQVWRDTGAGANFDNGRYDTDESPIAGVTLELWRDVDGDGVFEPTGDDS